MSLCVWVDVGWLGFLSALYPHYELVVWSQTSWRWLEMKLTELGMLTHSKYKILFVLDKSTMFRITSTQRGEQRKHHVKPLQLIWHKLPQFSPFNTVHVDDLPRNFALFPQAGLRIKAYKNSVVTKAHDRELLYLERYLTLIAAVDDFTTLDHNQWQGYLEKRGMSTHLIDSEFAQNGRTHNT